MARNPIVFMFSGQGSQYYGMGMDLYGKNAVYRKHFDDLCTLAYGLTGVSVKELIFDRRKSVLDQFDDPAVSSLAIYIVESALFKTLKDSGVVPGKVMGSSMGMFAACEAAGCIESANAIVVLSKLGDIVQRTCESGCMVAILDHSDFYYSSPLLSSSSEIAAINFSSSFVISLPAANLEKVESYLKSMGKTHQVLSVSRAYHSRWVEDAKARVLELFDCLGSCRPELPVYCCTASRQLEIFTPQVLWESLRGTLSFGKTIERIESTGTHAYVDVGPSGSLATSLKYILPSHSPPAFFTILSPFKQDAVRFDEVAKSLSR